MNQVNPCPIGTFRLNVHRVFGSNTEFVVNIETSGDLVNVSDSWVQAAACMLNNACQYSGCGFEKTMDLVTKQVYAYRNIKEPLQKPAADEENPTESPEFPTDFPTEPAPETG